MVESLKVGRLSSSSGTISASAEASATDLVSDYDAMSELEACAKNNEADLAHASIDWKRYLKQNVPIGGGKEKEMSDKKELVITRIFDVPRELVWKAWTDPETLKKWGGPKHFTAPEAKIDFRVGGRYLNCMQGPDGKKYYSTGVYKEIKPMEKIVCTDSFADEKGNVVPASHYQMPGEWPGELEVTVTFEEIEGGKTKMTLTHVGLPEGEMKEGAAAGWNESFDKLAQTLRNRSEKELSF